MDTNTGSLYLSFYIESVNNLFRSASSNYSDVSGSALAINQLQVFYAFQNATNPTFATSTSASVPSWNSVWIKANTNVGTAASTSTYYNYNQTNVANRYGLCQTSLSTSPNATTLTTAGTASFYRVFVPTYKITSTDNVYLYLRIALPMHKDMRFGRVYATYSK